MLDISWAIPVGLIVNELVTNSITYAFPDEFDYLKERKEPCTIRVSLSCEEGMFGLKISDNGRGVPEGFDFAETKTLGLRMVNFLAKYQIQAEISLNPANGTEFLIRFCENAPGSRDNYQPDFFGGRKSR